MNRFPRGFPCAAAGALGLKLALLTATLAFLLAHSPTGDAKADCSKFPAQRNEYQLSGECGSAGRIEIVAGRGNCDLFVEGDEVGLPRVGRRDHVPRGMLDEGNFSLYDPQVPRGLTCKARKLASGALSLLCSDLATSDGATCTATLERVEP